jgi:hypothetical protein
LRDRPGKRWNLHSRRQTAASDSPKAIHGIATIRSLPIIVSYLGWCRFSGTVHKPGLRCRCSCHGGHVEAGAPVLHPGSIAVTTGLAAAALETNMPPGAWAAEPIRPRETTWKPPLTKR